MNHFKTVWDSLNPTRRILVIGATVVTFVLMTLLAQMATSTRFALLYSGLDPAAAGEVIQALDGAAIPYEVRGSAIYVDAAQRDQTRMTLAGQGLPSGQGAGYELLDNLSGFGTTSQMFDAAYWRAKEGEIARTILSNPSYKSARVHLAVPLNQPFRREINPTASVTVTTKGAPVSAGQAKALAHLVSSAVAGLSAGAVSVIDSDAGLIPMGDDMSTPTRALDQADAMRQRVERLLTARMGPGRAVVEVSVETVTDRESIVERLVDPASRVAISTETEERSSASADQGGGAVTVASNLPEGDGAADRSASSNDTQTRERVNFEISETQREVLRGPGAIKRLTVAVLLDGQMVAGADGVEQWQPLPQDQMDALHDLVASAVGLDTARGDVLTLKSMPFEPTVALGTELSQPGFSLLPQDTMGLIQLGVLALVTLILGLFVLRPVLLGRGRAAPIELPPPAPETLDMAIDGSIVGDDQVLGPMAALGRPPETPAEEPAPDPVEKLRQLIVDRREESVALLRHWIEDPEETAR